MPALTVYIALFLSGFAALVYEVCWIRQASLVFGSTTQALSSVLAVFFLGLAIGSQLAGTRSLRVRRPLLALALVEALVALWALVASPLLSGAAWIYGLLYRTVGLDSSLLLLARVVLLALCLLPATILLGASLPLVSRFLVGHNQGIVRAVGRLYAVNTLGALVGCLAAGMWLIPTLGVRWSLWTGVLASACAAGLLLRLRAEQVEPPPPAQDPVSQTRSALLGLLFCLVGFTALGQEVLWARFLTLVLRTTVHTYTITLAVVLLGIVLGSMLVSRCFEQLRARVAWFGSLQVASGLVLLLVMSRPPAFWGQIGQELWVYLLLLLPTSVLSGMSFPLAVRMLCDDPRYAARDVGRLSALNTTGGILGSLFTGFFVIPRLGLHTGLYLLSGLGVTIGLLAWLGLEKSARPARRLVAVVAAAGLWCLLVALQGTRIPADFLGGDGQLIDFREGVAAHVAVIETDETRKLEIDRWWQGERRKSHQVLAAHLPMLLHPDPKSVLVVGVGTGQTSSRFLDHELAQLDCVDIEPAVFDVLRAHFDSEWMDDPRVRLIEQDGRNHILHTDRQYDLISLELGQLFRPGIAAFYSTEFYGDVRRRLRDGGLVSQFVPLPFLSEEQFRLVLRTFQDVFPECVLWYNTSELLLIGSARDKLVLREQRLRRLELEPLASDLSFSTFGGPAEWLSKPEVLLAGFLCGPTGVAALAGPGDTYRDDRPTLEYETARVDTDQSLELEIVDDLERRLEPVSGILSAPLGTDALARIGELRRANLADIVASALLRGVERLKRQQDYVELDRLLVRATAANPRSRLAHRLRADTLVYLQQPDLAAEAYARALEIEPQDPLAQRGMAFLLLSSGDFARAATHLRDVVRLRPEDAEAFNNLGVALAQQGQLEQAREMFQRALDIRPAYHDARINLSRANLGRSD